MKAVLDTNVLVAAFLTEGVCSKLLIRARKKQFNLISCPFIIDEFERVLRYKFRASPGETRTAIALVKEAAYEICRPTKSVARICRDADDDNVLVCAFESRADYLVTGDDDLLSLGSHKKKAIIRPRDFELLFKD